MTPRPYTKKEDEHAHLAVALLYGSRTRNPSETGAATFFSMI